MFADIFPLLHIIQFDCFGSKVLVNTLSLNSCRKTIVLFPERSRIYHPELNTEYQVYFMQIKYMMKNTASYITKWSQTKYIVMMNALFLEKFSSLLPAIVQTNKYKVTMTKKGST